MSGNKLKTAVVGATGLVGAELIEALSRRRFPVSELNLFASPAGDGESMEFLGGEVEVGLLKADFYKGMDMVFFAAPAMVSADLCEEAAASGALVIDSSNAFRQAPSVPLVVPEVNPEALANVWEGQRIIASPSAPAVAVSLVVNPLLKSFGVKRLTATIALGSTAAGRKGFEEHQQQTISIFNQNELVTERFPRQSAFNIFPHSGDFEGEHCLAERELMEELPKILGAEIPVAATAMQAPVFCGVAVSLGLWLEKEVSAREVREALSGSDEFHVLDDPANEVYPDTMEAMNHDEVTVGRIRKDPANPYGVLIWISADNLRKGSALNMVQIAELVLKVREKTGSP